MGHKQMLITRVPMSFMLLNFFRHACAIIAFARPAASKETKQQLQVFSHSSLRENCPLPKDEGSDCVLAINIDSAAMDSEQAAVAGPRQS
jgi:hypothetical protein